MKHSGILAAACFLAMAAGAQAAVPQHIALVCDNDGRCIQQVVQHEGATRVKRSAHSSRKIKASAQARRRAQLDASGNPAHPVTVPTAAGIAITAAPSFAAPAVAVIADLVAAGFTPRKLTCQSFAASHVASSLHFRSRACDVAQCGWGCTPAPKQTLRMIVARHGLRDGCEFGDAGHFDDGPHLPYARVLRNCGRAYAEAIHPGGGGRLVKLEQP